MKRRGFKKPYVDFQNNQKTTPTRHNGDNSFEPPPRDFNQDIVFRFFFILVGELPCRICDEKRTYTSPSRAESDRCKQMQNKSAAKAKKGSR